MTRNNEKIIIFIATVSSAGLIIANFIMGWEFWFPVLIVAGIAALWFVNLSGRIDSDIREVIYYGYALTLLFYFGIHKSSFFEIALITVLGLTVYSLVNKVYMLNGMLLEFFILLFIQIMNLPGGEQLVFNKATTSRLFLGITIVLLVYYLCLRQIGVRLDSEEESRKREEQLEANDSGMEDFLTNISHELRTPVNVVNGMSDLLIKKGTGYEAESIKNAGLRLANQIEDIQDYTECKRQSVFLEEDNYTSTSLINDVVTSFRLNESAGDLEMVVDRDPTVPTMLSGDIKKLHKIFRHLLENSVKFTKIGGIYVRIYTEKTDYGVNLCLEMTDTGIGMNRAAVRAISEGMYQENKKRNRSSGGIGLGLFIVYGFAHRMGGFVRIESIKNSGTTIRVTMPQKVVDPAPCFVLQENFDGAVIFHVKPDKYKVPKLREFYRNMAANLARGIHVPLISAETVYEVERIKEKMNITHVFMGQEEYEENRGYFEALAKEDVVVAVSADPDLKLPADSRIMMMPKPLYAYPIIKILNEGKDAGDLDGREHVEKPVYKGVRALIVDDEPMNLVVATMLFRDYEMIIDTAGSGREAIQKFHDNDYDLIFMDHMMPEMDGVEAMKQIKAVASDLDREIIVIALTANVVSGAREMFIKEGFDGFIAKPIDISDFERVMHRVLYGIGTGRGGEEE